VVFAAPKDFAPEYVFQGSSLTGWHTLGNATWRAENGEIIAKPDTPEGGWLVMDKGYQDVEFYTEFHCADKCDAGVLMRAEKTPEGGWKGVYAPISGDTGSFDLVLDASGKELKRTPLLRAAAQFARYDVGPWTNGQNHVPGFAALAPTAAEEAAAAANPPAPAAAAGGGRGAGGGGRGGAGAGGAAAGGRGGVFAGRGGAGRGDTAPPEWTPIDLIMDGDIFVNRRGGGNAATNDHMMGYGPIALHVGGTSEVRFRDVSLQDLNHKIEPAEVVSAHFKKQSLTDFMYSWGAAAGDINHDGIPDVVAGPFYFVGPSYTERREFTTVRAYSPTSSFPEGMTYFVHDYTGDGWADILCTDSRPIYLYVNPKGEPRRWDRYNVVPSATSELEVFGDLDSDGQPEVLFTGAGGTVQYAKPDPANPTGVWKVHNISEPGMGGAHGMGIGDMNGDGRMDVVNNRGWWEQPAKGSTDATWKYHQANFGSGGAEMGVYDVNGDGLADVVTVIAAHQWGIAWFEQKKDGTFVRHDIMGDYSTAKTNAGGVTFSEAHGAAFADMDGDGIPDMIVGKRIFSHLESHLDPDPAGPAVLYWYKTVRDPKAEGGARFVPELINNRSGVGSQFVVTDLNGDGAPDVVISDAKGTFVFWNQMHAKPQPARR
jgi:hypothetical protein